MKRKGIPLYVRLQACLYALGLEPGNVQWDHNPSIAMRPLNADGTDTEPAQNDPRYIVPLSREAHAAKTNGNRERADGDKTRIAKAKRLEEKHKEFWERLSPTRVVVSIPKPKRRIPSRPFRNKKA